MNNLQPNFVPQASKDCWMASDPCKLWLGKHCVLVAWIGLLAAIVLPPHGSGFLVCWLQSATGVPCPGCGLTRSLSCGVRGMFLESWQYHPLGLMILALFLFTAAQTLLPANLRHLLLRHVRSRTVLYQTLYVAFVVSFVVFGASRALVQCWGMFAGS
jgi:hypothetical protein